MPRRSKLNAVFGYRCPKFRLSEPFEFQPHRSLCAAELVRKTDSSNFLGEKSSKRCVVWWDGGSSNSGLRLCSVQGGGNLLLDIVLLRLELSRALERGFTVFLTCSLWKRSLKFRKAFILSLGPSQTRLITNDGLNHQYLSLLLKGIEVGLRSEGGLKLFPSIWFSGQCEVRGPFWELAGCHCRTTGIMLVRGLIPVVYRQTQVGDLRWSPHQRSEGLRDIMNVISEYKPRERTMCDLEQESHALHAVEDTKHFNLS
ncbi:hypothetical protein J6590_090100 [Homalodisca vitripennis]|nr:hypothetical protein J6590_090100 [Homalodisca vitripennis]